MPSTPTTLLEARNIAHFYGPRLIFKDVSLQVAPGTVTLLAGANGAGKSTLLKILAGLVRPSMGDVVEKEEARVGYVGHQTFIYPELTALENLRFWATLYNEPIADEGLRAMLHRMDLAPFAEERAKVFSRGMAQRLNLARAFMLKPDILLLDEPGTGLDTRSYGVLLREIEGARTHGAGIVWISHSVAADRERADMLAYLAGGKLAFYGPAEAFHPAEAETSAIPPLPSEAEGSLPNAVQPEPAETRNAQGGDVC